MRVEKERLASGGPDEFVVERAVNSVLSIQISTEILHDRLHECFVGLLPGNWSIAVFWWASTGASNKFSLAVCFFSGDNFLDVDAMSPVTELFQMLGSDKQCEFRQLTRS